MKSFLKILIILGLITLSLISCKRNTEPVDYPEYFQSPIFVEAEQGRYFTIWAHTDTKISGYSRVYILEIDENGNRIWEQEYSYGITTSAIRASNGDFIMGGTNYASPGAFIMRINHNGTKLWATEYIRSYDYSHTISSIIELDDSKIFSTGKLCSGGMFLSCWGFSFMLSQNGEILGQYDWGGGGVVKTNDSGIIMYEVYKKGFGWDYYSDKIVKRDKNLNVVWSETLGDSITIVSIDKIGNEYIAIGVKIGTSQQLVLIKFDEEGNILSSKFVDRLNYFVNLLSVKAYNDGIIVLVSDNISVGNPENAIVNVAKIDLDGNILWQKSFEKSQTGTVGRTSDGNYIVLLEGLRFIKISQNGEVLIDKKL